MLRRSSLVALAVALPLAVAACADRREPIIVAEGTVNIENQTRREWRNVRITVNDHFNGGAPRLAAGGRLTAPLSQLQTSYGQRFSLARQSVFKVEVTATDDMGERIALQWGQARR